MLTERIEAAKKEAANFLQKELRMNFSLAERLVDELLGIYEVRECIAAYRESQAEVEQIKEELRDAASGLMEMEDKIKRLQAEIVRQSEILGEWDRDCTRLEEELFKVRADAGKLLLKANCDLAESQAEVERLRARIVLEVEDEG